MKKQFGILMIVCLIMAVSTLSVMAQKTENKKEKQEEMLKKEAEEQQQKFFDYQKDLERYSREVVVGLGTARDAYGYVSADNAFVVSGRSQSSSRYEYTKSVKEASFTKDISFEIENEAHRASIIISGSCRQGEILIKITMPSGKAYTEMLIDEYGSVNWSKSFTIDEEDKSKTGEWKCVIVAKDATGNFRLSVRSN